MVSGPGGRMNEMPCTSYLLFSPVPCYRGTEHNSTFNDSSHETYDRTRLQGIRALERFLRLLCEQVLHRQVHLSVPVEH